MSHYAWFACTDCRHMVWLGREVFKSDGRVELFHIGEADDPPNSQRPELNRTLWKMLADHVGHPLRVVTDDHAEYQHLEGYIEIGGDGVHDIAFETYLRDWKG